MTTALVIGGTGLVGSHLVKQLALPNSAFSKVFLIARNASKLNLSEEASAKITPIEVPDFDSVFGPSSDPGQILSKFESGPTHAFCCLGTTRAKAGSDEAFRRVDYDYVYGFGQLCKQIQSKFDNSLETFSLVSSAGASASSWFLYPRTKGQSEEIISTLLTPVIPRVHILRPGMLKYPIGTDNSRKEKRLVEEVVIRMDPLLEWVGPGKYSINSDDVARAMIKLSTDKSLSKEATTIFENKDLRDLTDNQ
jgi:oxidoreductase